MRDKAVAVRSSPVMTVVAARGQWHAASGAPPRRRHGPGPR